MSEEEEIPKPTVFDGTALGRALTRGDAAAPTPDTIRAAAEVMRGAPASEELPAFDRPADVVPQIGDENLVSVLAERSLVAEEFRVVLAKLRVISEERALRCIGVVSSIGGEGKTTLALGLAATLARIPNRRTLLIEADLRRPSIEKHLGLWPERGVGEWLEGGPEPLPVRNVMPHGFHVLTSGLVPLRRPELLASRRMAALFEAARQAFHFVIVDCPPIAPVADSVLLQDLVDGFLFVVRAEATPRAQIVRAASQLKPGRIRGLLFNRQRSLLARDDAGGYDGYRYGGERARA
jgi:Mrp family chromosome partitioning ATPase